MIEEPDGWLLEYLRGAGDVVSQYSHPGSRFAETFGRIAQLQASYSSQNTPEMQERGVLVRQTAPSIIQDFLAQGSVGGVEDVKVRGQDGVGLKNRVPFVRVFSQDLSPKPTQGWYVVYLFSTTGDSVYLSINQGTTKFENGSFVPRDPEELKESAESARQLLREELIAHGRFTTEMVLDDTANGLGAGYEIGSVGSVRYDIHDLPIDDTARMDLQAAVQMLSQLYQSDASDQFHREAPEMTFPAIAEYVAECGMLIDEQTLRRYHLSLGTRGFVILSGVSGTGKTWLAELYAQAVGAECQIVPVAPNWTSNEDLLGYFNPLDNTYHDTPFSLVLRQASSALLEARENRTDQRHSTQCSTR